MPFYAELLNGFIKFKYIWPVINIDKQRVNYYKQLLWLANKM